LQHRDGGKPGGFPDLAVGKATAGRPPCGGRPAGVVRRPGYRTSYARVTVWVTALSFVSVRVTLRVTCLPEAAAWSTVAVQVPSCSVVGASVQVVPLS